MTELTFEQEVNNWLNVKLEESRRMRWGENSYRLVAQELIKMDRDLSAGKSVPLFVKEIHNGYGDSRLIRLFYKKHEVHAKVKSGIASGSVGRIIGVSNSSYWKADYNLEFKDGKKKRISTNILVSTTEEVTELLEANVNDIAPNDMLKRKIKIGDFVAYASKTYGMTIGNISKIDKSGKVYIKPLLGGKLDRKWVATTESRVEYPNELIILDDQTFKEFMLLKLQKM